MRIIKKTLATLSLACLFSLPAHAGGYHNHSGISVNIGSHHNGISLSYRAPIKQHYNYNKKHQKAYSYKQPKQHKKSYIYKQAKQHKKSAIKYYSKPYVSYKHKTKSLPKYHPNKVTYISKSCHPVTQLVGNRHGRYDTVVVGKQCYDRRGLAYLIPNKHYNRH